MMHKEVIGLATLYLGDCREIAPGLEPESVTLLWTDPPYGHGNHDGDLNARLHPSLMIKDIVCTVEAKR